MPDLVFEDWYQYDRRYEIERGKGFNTWFLHDLIKHEIIRTGTFEQCVKALKEAEDEAVS